MQMDRPYSTPSKRTQAPSTATQASSIHDLPPPFVPSGQNKQEPSPLAGKHLTAFLQQKTPLTILPVPLPDDKTSTLNDFYFPDSHTQDLVAIIDTCLNECYDVPRARNVFEAMRMNNRGEYLLKVPVFNKFLQAYAIMAARHETHREEWLKEAWILFNRMEAGEEKAVPDAVTYATMIQLWKRSGSPSFLHPCILSSYQLSTDMTQPRIRPCR